MEYRRATVADAPLLASMNGQLIRDEGCRNRMTAPELEARMTGWLGGGDYEAVLFEEAGTALGYALFRREPEHVYLRQFFVRPDCRRRGVGRSAIGWLGRNAWHGSRVRIDVLVGNVAGLAFWRAVGFADYCLTLEHEGGDTSAQA
jgi:GNAT superfamily N-acetyltransferase